MAMVTKSSMTLGISSQDSFDRQSLVSCSTEVASQAEVSEAKGRLVAGVEAEWRSDDHGTAG